MLEFGPQVKEGGEQVRVDPHCTCRQQLCACWSWYQPPESGRGQLMGLTEGSRKACHPFSPLMRARRKEMTADAMRIFTRRSSNCFNTSFQKGVPAFESSSTDEGRGTMIGGTTPAPQRLPTHPPVLRTGMPWRGAQKSSNATKSEGLGWDHGCTFLRRSLWIWVVARSEQQSTEKCTWTKQDIGLEARACHRSKPSSHAV